MQSLTLRPLTVGDLRELGPDWPAALAALTQWAALPDDAARLAALPAVAAAMAPCLCRMTALTPDALDGLDLAALTRLLCAALEANARPFVPTPG